MKKWIIVLAALLAAVTVQARKKDIAKHVIIIGLDGWGTWCMEDAKLPFIREKMQEGSYTLYKRTVRPSSSGPNWSAILNGTPVESSGIIDNKPTPSFKPLVLTEHNGQPTIFHLMRQERPDAEMGIVCEWGGVLNYADTLCLNYKKHVWWALGNPEATVEESVKYIMEKKPVICFIHFDSPDHAGHDYGKGSPEYFKCIEHVDGQIRQIVDGIKAAGIYDDSIIIITSDHGHEGRSHGGDSLNEIETPFVIWGKGVKKGHVITETMLQYDVAATVAKIFHLKTPQSWRGVPMDVFTKK